MNAGDQALSHADVVSVAKVNASDFTAWKEGVILTRDASLQEICGELERWYDVKFVFPNGFKNYGKAFNSINRSEMLSAVLIALKNTYEVDFVIKGKEVIVR